MNLNFTEIDDLANNDNFDVNSYQSNNNYWETTKNQSQAPKKKKVSYDDILNSLDSCLKSNKPRPNDGFTNNYELHFYKMLKEKMKY